LLPDREPPADDDPLFDLEPLLIPELPPLFEAPLFIPELLPLRELPLFVERPLIEPPRDPLDDPDLLELLLFILFAINSANPLMFFVRKVFSSKKKNMKKSSHILHFNNARLTKMSFRLHKPDVVGR
jgi:hypothetical protein